MKKLVIISMLVLSIAEESFCQKSKSKYDTLTVLEGVRPPILARDFHKRSELYSNEEVKKNDNHIIIDFGNKNRLLLDYQGVKKYKLTQNVDSLLSDFWKNYSLIRDTLNNQMVKKITYFGKNKNVNRKAMIDVQYYPQKEVFQFGRSVELVRLKQDTLVIINFDDEATSQPAKSANRIIKTYPEHTFLFNLNSLDDIEDILETNINKAIAEAIERATIERKNAYPWKSVNIENDLMSQKIRSKIKGSSLFNYINIRGDIGTGYAEGLFQSSTTLALEIASPNYYRKGFMLGLQVVITPNKKSEFDNTQTFFTGMTFYKKTNDKPQFKGGLFLGVNSTSIFTHLNQGQFTLERNTNIKFFGWYQLTPLIRIQPELYSLQFKSIKSNIPPSTSTRQTSFMAKPGLRISFGF